MQECAGVCGAVNIRVRTLLINMTQAAPVRVQAPHAIHS